MLDTVLLCLGSFVAGFCSHCRAPKKSSSQSRSLSAARKGRRLRGPDSPLSPSSPRSPSKATQATQGTWRSERSAASYREAREGREDEEKSMWFKARSALSYFSKGGIPHVSSARSSLQTLETNWRGRIWSFKLGPGASTTVEGRFCDDGAHWIVTMKDRGPSVDVKAVLLTNEESHELEHDTAQSFHGQTPICEGEAVLQLHFRNRHASITERQVEVKMFLFHTGARIGEHSFVRQPMLSWMSELMSSTYLRRDVKLKADSISVVEVERVMHDQLWDRYVKTRRGILSQLARESNEHFAHASTCCEILTDKRLPLPLSQGANEHWLFHGTSAENAISILEGGFDDQSQLTHGSAFGSGIYFTECSSKADMYTTPAEHTDGHDHGGMCCMLLCRVTLGRSRKLDTQFHVDKAELEKEMATGRYHSVLADRERLFSSYREFITPAAQVYPEFIIWYDRNHKSGLQQWKDRHWGGDLF